MGNSSPPNRAFCAARPFERSNSTGVQSVNINTLAVSAGIEVGRLIEQLAPTRVPSESIDDLVPGGLLNPDGKAARVGIEPRPHTTSVSLWSARLAVASRITSDHPDRRAISVPLALARDGH